MTWRKLIACFVAASGTLFALTNYFAFSSAPYTPEWIAHFFLAVLGIAGVQAAPFVWRGRYWSLWLLRVVCLGAVAALIVLSVLDFMALDLASDSAAGNLAFYGLLLCFPAFFVFFLWHPQVVSEFRADAVRPDAPAEALGAA